MLSVCVKAMAKRKGGSHVVYAGAEKGRGRNIRKVDGDSIVKVWKMILL